MGIVMGPRKSKNSLPRLSHADTLVLPPGETLSTFTGLWSDTEYLFVKKDPNVLKDYYFRDAQMDYYFENYPGANTHMAPLQPIAHNDK